MSLASALCRSYFQMAFIPVLEAPSEAEEAEEEEGIPKRRRDQSWAKLRGEHVKPITSLSLSSQISHLPAVPTLFLIINFAALV